MKRLGARHCKANNRHVIQRASFTVTRSTISQDGRRVSITLQQTATVASLYFDDEVFTKKAMYWDINNEIWELNFHKFSCFSPKKMAASNQPFFVSYFRDNGSTKTPRTSDHLQTVLQLFIIARLSARYNIKNISTACIIMYCTSSNGTSIIFSLEYMYSSIYFQYDF